MKRRGRSISILWVLSSLQVVGWSDDWANRSLSSNGYFDLTLAVFPGTLRPELEMNFALSETLSSPDSLFSHRLDHHPAPTTNEHSSLLHHQYLTGFRRCPDHGDSRHHQWSANGHLHQLGEPRVELVGAIHDCVR
jgi:hypothetical protein